MTRADLDKELATIHEKYGIFFAFSNKQYEENAKDGIKYINYGFGLFCPKSNIENFLADFGAAVEQFRKDDIAENGKKKVIWRELSNHECQISMDISNAVKALKGYGITKEEVEQEWKEYFNYCVDNDLF
ncbi:MAG: hypothetical protein PHI97_00380 [Desulfobulbus sp.]|nr:hypothetical protein [Desulfobulbus sp.]